MRLPCVALLLAGCSLTNVGKDLQQVSCEGQPFEFCDELNVDYPSGDACRVWRCHPTEKVCALYGPDFPELCDGVDNNCNNQIDEGMYTPIGAPVRWTVGTARFDQTAVAARRHSEDPRVVDIAPVVVSDNHTHGLLADALVDMAELDDLFAGNNRLSAAVASSPSGFVIATSLEFAVDDDRLQWHSFDSSGVLLGGSTDNLLTPQSELALAVDGDAPNLGLLLSQDRAAVPIAQQNCFVPDSDVELYMRRLTSSDIDEAGVLLGKTFESYPPGVLAVADDSYLVAYQRQVSGNQMEIEIASVDALLDADRQAAVAAPSVEVPIGEPRLAASSDGTMVALVYREDCIDRDGDGLSDGGEPAIQLVLYTRQLGTLDELKRVEVTRGISFGGARRPIIYYQEFDLPGDERHAEWLVAWEDGARQLLLSRFAMDGTPLEEKLVLAESLSLSEGAHLVPGAGENGVTALTASTAAPDGTMLAVPLCQAAP